MADGEVALDQSEGGILVVLPGQHGASARDELLLAEQAWHYVRAAAAEPMPARLRPAVANEEVACALCLAASKDAVAAALIALHAVSDEERVPLPAVARTARFDILRPVELEQGIAVPAGDRNLPAALCVGVEANGRFVLNLGEAFDRGVIALVIVPASGPQMFRGDLVIAAGGAAALLRAAAAAVFGRDLAASDGAPGHPGLFFASADRFGLRLVLYASLGGVQRHQRALLVFVERQVSGGSPRHDQDPLPAADNHQSSLGRGGRIFEVVDGDHNLGNSSSGCESQQGGMQRNALQATRSRLECDPQARMQSNALQVPLTVEGRLPADAQGSSNTLVLRGRLTGSAARGHRSRFFFRGRITGFRTAASRVTPPLPSTTAPGDPTPPPTESTGCEIVPVPKGAKLDKFRGLLGEFMWFAVPQVLIFYPRKVDKDEETNSLEVGKKPKATDLEKIIVMIFFLLFVSLWVTGNLLATFGTEGSLWVTGFAGFLSYTTVLSVIAFIDYVLYKEGDQETLSTNIFVVHFLAMFVIVTIIWLKYVQKPNWRLPDLKPALGRVKSWYVRSSDAHSNDAHSNDPLQQPLLSRGDAPICDRV